MKNVLLVGAVMTAALLCGGCQTLENVNSGVEAVGKPVGTAARIPQSATQGIANGYVGEQDANPYGR